VPVAVASGAVRAEVEAVLEGSGLRPLLKTVVTADDVAQGKPDPEGYLMALDRLGVRGADALSFEDTHFGVMAAVAAGMRCVGVGTTMSADRLLDAGAEAVVAGLDWSIPDMRGFFA
jgi:sugar-phosphatase